MEQPRRARAVNSFGPSDQGTRKEREGKGRRRTAEFREEEEEEAANDRERGREGGREGRALISFPEKKSRQRAARRGAVVWPSFFSSSVRPRPPPSLPSSLCLSGGEALRAPSLPPLFLLLGLRAVVVRSIDLT